MIQRQLCYAEDRHWFRGEYTKYAQGLRATPPRNRQGEATQEATSMLSGMAVLVL
jgi:hypothetical protein